MKLNTIFLAISLLFITNLLSAKTWRVNNALNAAADFTNLKEAHDAATDGDTLLIEGSTISYGILNCEKRLVFIGTGYFLTELQNTVTSNTSTLSSIRFNSENGSNRNTGAAGSQLIGIEITNDIRVFASNILISKCKIYTMSINGEGSFSRAATGVKVMQNYFTYRVSLGSTPLIDVMFANNIFTDNFSIEENSNGAILHNLFAGDKVTIENFTGEISSNVLTSRSATDVKISTVNESQISFNTAANGQFGSANNNSTTSPNALFVGTNNNSTDGQWQLKPNSPAANNAHDGTDRGPFGGNTPYSLSGQGGIPVINFLQVQPSAIQNQKISVRIRAISGN